MARNAIIIDADGTDSIDGAGTLVLSSAYAKAALLLVFDGTNWVWVRLV